MPRPFVALAGALFALVALNPTAHAADAGDPRAVGHDGSVGTCAAAGLSGSTIPSDKVAADVKERAFIDVLDHTGITAVVIAGGPGYNVYKAEKLGKGWADLHAPVKADRLPEEIGYWFACGTLVDPPSSSVTTPPSSTPPTTTTTTTTSSTAPTTITTTAAAPAGPNDLAATGVASAWLVGVGAALLAAGAALLLVLRRRRA